MVACRLVVLFAGRFLNRRLFLFRCCLTKSWSNWSDFSSKANRDVTVLFRRPFLTLFFVVFCPKGDHLGWFFVESKSRRYRIVSLSFLRLVFCGILSKR